jgi:hypothetical protein
MILWARVKSYMDVRFYAERPGPEPETWMLMVKGRYRSIRFANATRPSNPLRAPAHGQKHFEFGIAGGHAKRG